MGSGHVPNPALLPGALAVGDTRPPPPPPGVNKSDKTKGKGESRGVPVLGIADDGFFRQK